MLESIIRDRVMEHLESNRLLSECQHGFVPGRSCTTNLLACMEDWTLVLDEGRDVDTIYLDLAKAFDSVPHVRLLKKVEALGVHGQVLTWISDFLTGRRQRVSVNGSLSEWSSVLSGVPQGSVLGPILFVMFINDLPQAVSSLCKMYADDTKVYKPITSAEDGLTLQEDLDRLVDWADRWQLRFNADKCSVLHMGRKKPQCSYTMRKHGGVERTALRESDMERDLGVHVDSTLSFSRHIEIQVNKANRILGLIRRSFEYLDCEAMKLLFTSLVRPHLEFGNIVWSPRLEKDKKLVEGVQRRATKVVGGMKDIPYEQRLARMKLPSMMYRRIRGDLIETFKYTHSMYKIECKGFVNNTDSTTRGHRYKLKKARSNTTLRQTFFSQRVVDRWNGLPSEVVDAPSLNSFKNRLDAHMKDYVYCVEEPPTVVCQRNLEHSQ